MFQGKNIGFYTAGKKILEEVSVSAFPGKLTVIAGPNGAGKSTLLKVLSGDCRPTAGKVTINGKMLENYRLRELALVRAILPQRTQVSLPFTVEEVVALGRLPHETLPGENREVVETVMHETDIFSLRKRVFQTLSGGEQQRVHLARVLAQVSGPPAAPCYLLLDEPTASLDIAQQHGLLGIIKKRCLEHGYGVVAVIHDINLAAQYADFILFMRDGKEVGQGPMGMMLTEEMLAHTFSYPVKILWTGESKAPVIFSQPFDSPNRNSSINNNNNNLKYLVNGKYSN